MALTHSPLDHVILFVSDIDRAVRFYRDVLGLQVLSESPAFAQIQLGTGWLGLHITDDSQDIGHGAIPYLLVDNLPEELESLRDQQVDIRFGPNEVPGGHIATFKDSEGNTIGLYATK